MQTPAEQSLHGRDNAEWNAGAGGDRSRFGTLGRCVPSWSDECRRGLRGHGQPPPAQQHRVQWSNTDRPASPDGGRATNKLFCRLRAWLRLIYYMYISTYVGDICAENRHALGQRYLKTVACRFRNTTEHYSDKASKKIRC